jgi:hypothetical protein
LQYNLNFSWCSLQCSLMPKTYDGNFWYSSMCIVVWPLDGFTEPWYSKHYVHSPSSQSGHQTSDGLEIWPISHIPQTDGELDMLLISCNILLKVALITISQTKSIINCHKSLYWPLQLIA